MTEIKEALNILEFTTQCDVKHSTALLESIKVLLYDGKSCKAAITGLNKQAANALTKEQSFDILLKILPDCSNSIVEENAKAWANYAISKHKHEVVAGCRFKFLVELYNRCHTNQEFYKMIVTNLLLKIIDTCLWVHEKSVEAEHSLYCLYNTMKFFASACIVYKKRIEEYVLIYMDTSSKIDVTCQAAKCYHILNQIGGAGPNGSIHIKNYEDNFAKLYKTLHVLYNSMFENINEFRESVQLEENANYIQFKPIPTYFSTMDVYKLLSRRIENIVVFLIEMLQTGFKVKKTIKPEILEVIQRGLDIHVHGDENDPNRVIFNQYIQAHQLKLLYLLKAIIQSLQQNFMRYMTIKMLVRYLARVSDCTCYNINSFYKSSIYGVIKYWLEHSGEQIDSKMYEKLIELIIKDITPNKATLVLQINVANKSGKSKKKSKETTITNQPATDNEDTPRIMQTRAENCSAALELLELLFKTVHLNIKKTTCAVLFNIITGTLLNICVNYITPPYTLKSCRLNLFKVFIAIFDQSIHTIDIDIAVNILSLAQNSIDDEELSLICQSGLKTIEKIVHPIQPSMCIPQETSTVNQQHEAKKNSITVLTNLLIQSTNIPASETVSKALDSFESKTNTVSLKGNPETTTSEKLTLEVKSTDAPLDINATDEQLKTNIINNTNSDADNVQDYVVEFNGVEETSPKRKKKHLNETTSDFEKDSNSAVVEISDNEPELLEEEDISIIEETDEAVSVPTKKRKADDQQVIYTFDISDDPMESFVDEIN